MQTLTELTEGPDHPTSTEKSTTPWAKSRCDRADNPLTPIPLGLWKLKAAQNGIIVKMSLLQPSDSFYFLWHHLYGKITSKHNFPKQREISHCWKITQNVALEFGDFPPILVIINLLLSTQNVNVASLTILSETFSNTVQCGKISEDNSALIFFSWSKK